MSDPLHAIALAAAELKLAAPERFDQLVDAFKAFEERARDDLVAAGDNVVFKAQGKAWLMTQLRVKLERCLDIKREYESRK